MFSLIHSLLYSLYKKTKIKNTYRFITASYKSQKKQTQFFALNLKGGDSVTKLTKSIEIEAPPEKVFAFITDMEKMNEITKGFQETSYTSKGPVGVGSTMHVVGKAGGSQEEFDMEITEFEKNKKIIMRTIGASKLKVQTSDILEPTANGTKLTGTMDYELPYSILGKIVDKLRVSKDLEKTMEKNQRNLKKALEK